MRIDILTLFPNMFRGPFDESIVRRAQDKSLVEINIHNLRRWAIDKTVKLSSASYKHGMVDDKPYGGGVGMIMRVDVADQAISSLVTKYKSSSTKLILLDPSGTPFNQLKAQEMAKLDHLILIAGHYEGVDQRVKDYLVDEEVSIGDYVLTGGELPAMVIVDAVVRLIPGVLEKPEAIANESFQPPKSNLKPLTSNIQLLEHPQYTRPKNFKGWKVPKVLLSGNHKEIEKWRIEKAFEKTKKRRPDLLK